MTYLFIFVSGMLFYGVAIPLLGTALECIETKKEVFVSNHSVLIARNNSIIKAIQSEGEQSSLSAICFECPSIDECEDDEYYEDDHAGADRKVGFQ